jgi:hypothetical protein
MKTYLSAREWLEDQRLAGCEWAPELLNLLDAQNELHAYASAIEGITYVANRSRNRDRPKICDDDPAEVEREVCRRLNLLQDLEHLIDEVSADIAFPNGTCLSDAADKLEAMLEAILDSPHGLTYDL